MIFDFPEVDITKDSGSLSWVVRNPKTGSIIVRVSFAYLFTWESLLSSHHAEDLFSVIEAGVGMDGWPTPDELLRIEKSFPGSTSKTPLLDPHNLDSLRINWVISAPDPQPSAKAPIKKGKKSSLLHGKRKFIL
jgi:hypothetical protein